MHVDVIYVCSLSPTVRPRSSRESNVVHLTVALHSHSHRTPRPPTGWARIPIASGDGTVLPTSPSAWPHARHVRQVGQCGLER